MRKQPHRPHGGGGCPRGPLPVIGQNALGCKNGSVVAGLVQGTAAADGR